MRRIVVLLGFVGLAGCTPVIADVNDDSNSGAADGLDDSDSDTDTDTDSDTDTAADDGDGEPEPSVADWAGDWFAEVELTAELPRDWGGDTACVGEISIEVDDDGDVSGDGICSVEGWRTEAELEFEGTVDADGSLDGVLFFATDWFGETDLDVEGSGAGEDAIDSEVDGVWELESDWGSLDVPMSGELMFERD